MRTFNDLDLAISFSRQVYCLLYYIEPDYRFPQGEVTKLEVRLLSNEAIHIHDDMRLCTLDVNVI